ncbi:MAG: hypothetical protein Q9192_001960 [Flavoplaca navasiana]
MHDLYRSIACLLSISLAFTTLSLGQRITTTQYPRDVATCVSADDRLYPYFGDTGFVLVQPNCDVAIDALCAQVPLGIIDLPYASFVATAGTNDTDPTSDDTPDTCQAHLVGLGENNLLKLADYDTCVRGFQNITIDCMLLDYGEHAKRGMQAGVKGVQIEFPDPANASLPDDVKIRSIGLLDPGFLVGPPGYFGNVSLDEEVAQRLGIQAAPFVVPLRLETAPGQSVKDRVKEVTALGEVKPST